MEKKDDFAEKVNNISKETDQICKDLNRLSTEVYQELEERYKKTNDKKDLHILQQLRKELDDNKKAFKTAAEKVAKLRKETSKLREEIINNNAI